MGDSPEQELQLAIQERLRVIPELVAQGVEVFAEVTDDHRSANAFVPVNKQLEEAMLSTGIAVEVTAIGGDQVVSEDLLTCQPRVLVHENGHSNDTGLTTQGVVHLIRQSLRVWSPDTAWSEPRGISTSFLESGSQNRAMLNWVQDLLVDEPETVALPTIEQAGATITLGCATVGAAIFYTTDGGYPSAANGAAYSGPFDLDPGNHTLRVAAEKAGLLPSDVAREEITIS